MKKISILFATVILMFNLTQGVYASDVKKTLEASEVWLELNEDAIKNGDTIIFDLGEGATLKISPAPIIEPYLNVTKTMTLTTSWAVLTSDSPFLGTTVKVVNKKGNPGYMDVKVETSYFTNNTYFYWSLPPDYQAEFTIGMPNEYTIYVAASSAEYRGNYSILATDW